MKIKCPKCKAENDIKLQTIPCQNCKEEIDLENEVSKKMKRMYYAGRC